MKSFATIARRLVVLALVTIFIASFIAFASYAVGRPPTATHTLQPTLPPPLTPTNGKIAFLRTDTDYTVNGIYLIDPDGSNEQRVPYTESDSTPVWSPNGMRLAVIHLASPHSGAVSGYGVEVMNSDGSGRVRFNDNVEPGERIAWSPDGTKIAYTSWSNFSPNADIILMDANTGADIVNLTNDPSYDYLPSWSPDGTKIAFTSNRSGNLDVFVMNADGSNPQNITNYYANDYYPSWSPDGSKIVFVSSGRDGTFDNDEICLMNADGSGVVNLTLNQVPDLMPAWSPDGTKIIFNSDRNGNRDLYSMNADGSNETRVTVHTAEDSRASWQQTPISTPTPTPTPSPAPPLNGNIAFTRVGPPAERVATINEDGSNLTDLTANTNAEDPEFSPDGTRIAFSSVSNGQFRIWVMNSDGSGSTRLTNNGLRGDDEPTWSPDGSKIAFVGGGQIWAINADGTNEINLSSGRTGDNDPDWSPDGSKIVFTKDYSSPNAQTFVMNTDGSNLVNLSNTAGSGAERDPAWSPDGSKIAYQSFQDGHYEIYVMNADGSGETRITNNGFSVANEHPDWSPDGLKIVFSSTRDNNEQEIYVMNADGTGQTRLTNDPVLDEHPSWGLYVAPTPTPTPPADLAATADAQPYQVAPGGNLIFNSVVTNNGPGLATDMRVEVIVPPDVPINNIDAPGGSCTTTPDPQGLGYKVSCWFGNVPSGDVRTVALSVTVNAIDGAGLQAITTASSSAPDPDTNNNVAYAPAIVRDPTPPSANLFASGGLDLLVANGATVTHNLFTFNNGPNAAMNAKFTIQLPPGATYGTATNPFGSCVANAPNAQGTLVTCALGDIPAFDSRFISHTATVTGAPYDVLTFTSTVSSDTFDPFLDSNVVSVPVQIAGPPVPTPTPATGINPLIAFETRRDGNSEIYSRRADGSAQVNLTNNPADDTDFVWSPNGSKLAFSRLVDESSNNRDLFVMNADGTNVVRLTNSPDDQDSGAVWSPDGTKLLFISQSNVSNTGALWVTNADGSNQIRIGVAAFDYDNDPTWSPDGTKIAYTRNFYDGVNPPVRNIYTANADGTNRVRFSNAAGESDFTPDWSADGTKINFVRVRNDGVADVYDMHADGSNQRNLSNIQNVASYPALSRSADRGKIAFVSGNYGNMEIYVMNADGSSPVHVFHTTDQVAALGWSPDGTKLVVGTTFNTGLGAGIYVANADGTGYRHFGGDGEYNQQPDWSPDGSRIAFTTRRTGNGGIDIINADGTGRVDLTNAPAYYTHPKWQPLTPGNTPAGTNITVTQNGATVTFSNVTTAGETTITPIDPNSLTGVPGEYVINANSLAFEIHTTAVYSGPITIGFQVPGVNNPITFSALRVLHGEPPPVPNFVDRTVLAPDTPAPNFATRTIYARVTSLSPFIILEKPANQLTALGPAQVWIGLKNSDDVGTKFDLLAEVFKNGTLVGSGQINDVAGGSSGFNNAKLDAINLAFTGHPTFGAGTTLSIRLSVRIAASSGHRSGTARLWFNDSGANSRFSATIGGATSSYYLRKPSSSLVLLTTAGGAVTTRLTIDVLVDRAVGGNAFKPFGTWAITF